MISVTSIVLQKHLCLLPVFNLRSYVCVGGGGGGGWEGWGVGGENRVYLPVTKTVTKMRDILNCHETEANIFHKNSRFQQSQS